jgi:hypothetical protein
MRCSGFHHFRNELAETDAAAPPSLRFALAGLPRSQNLPIEIYPIEI